MERREVVIVGGGISGAAGAYELARRGVSVTLVERDELASMGSGWTMAGVRQSGRDPAELPLAMAAVRRWETLAAELGADVEYRQEGNLRLALTEDEVASVARAVEEQQATGLDIHYLGDNAAVRSVAPSVSDIVLAAAHCPTDGHANPVKAVHAFAAAAERHGAVIRTGVTVTGVEVAGGRVTGVQTTEGRIAADAVVIAAGVYAPRLLDPLGLGFPITVKQVSVVQTVPLPPLVKQVLGLASGRFAGRQEVGGRMRITNSSSPWQWPERGLSPDSLQPPARAVAAIIEQWSAIVPAIAEAPVARVWSGLTDHTPDVLPVLDQPEEIEGLVVAAGFSGHGFCLGPITGQIIRELVERGESTMPLEPFRLHRFDLA